MFNYIEEFIKRNGNSNFTMEDYVNGFMKEITYLQNDEFSELLLYVYIPESYDDNSSEEKIYTKLIEVLVKNWADRMGFHGTLLKQKSAVEDVRIIIGDGFIVCDAKTYRLSRSQKAPNVKDFVQLDSINEWINNARLSTPKLKPYGGLITYTKSHEWSRSSDVYRQCSNPETPILMLSYDVLSILLKFKKYIDDPKDILNLWNFNKVFDKNINTNNKKIYWKSMNKAIYSLINPTNDSILNSEFKTYFKFLNKKHKSNIGHQLERLNKKIEKNTEYVYKQLKNIDDIEVLREELVTYKTDIINNPLKKQVENIKKFRLD